MRRYPLDATAEEFEMVTVFDKPMLFTCSRVDRSTVPEDLYMYEVRHDDDMQGLPVEIAEWIFVNHWGTLISKTPIELVPREGCNNSYRLIDPEEDWNYEGFELTIEDYLKETDYEKGNG